MLHIYLGKIRGECSGILKTFIAVVVISEGIGTGHGIVWGKDSRNKDTEDSRICQSCASIS